MQSTRNHHRTIWREILLTCASVVLGVIIGPLLDKFISPGFSTEIRAALISILALGLLIIIGITVVSIFMRRSDEQRLDLASELQIIRQQMGLCGTFVYDLPRQDATGELYKKSAELIERAEKSIWALWYQRSPQQDKSEDDLRSEIWKQQQVRYHRLLCEKCQYHKHDAFFYRRIVQIPQPAKVKDGILSRRMLSATMTKHCQEMLEIISQYPESAIIKYAPILTQQTFVLIDDRYILWEIDATDPDTNTGYMDGLIIFDDKDGTFVQYLKNFFLKADKYGAVVKQVIDS